MDFSSEKAEAVWMWRPKFIKENLVFFLVSNSGEGENLPIFSIISNSCDNCSRFFCGGVIFWIGSVVASKVVLVAGTVDG